MKFDRRAMNREMRADLDVLSRWTRIFVDKWFRASNTRHSKTTITFRMDKFTIDEIDSHYRRSGRYKKPKD